VSLSIATHGVHWPVGLGGSAGVQHVREFIARIEDDDFMAVLEVDTALVATLDAAETIVATLVVRDTLTGEIAEEGIVVTLVSE
jgi:hypothetical protein